MNTSYCTECGCKLNENDTFCPNCGRKIQLVQVQEMNLPFSCMVAYLPGLFFVPLLTGFHDNRHRKCASQGLWITILAVISIISFPYLLKWGAQMQLFDWNHLTSLYQNWTETNWTDKFIPLIVFHWIMLPSMLYVPVNSLCGFFHGTHNYFPYVIPLFGRFNLISMVKEEEEA